MKLLTFLGAGNYKQVEYIWGDQRYRTDLFPSAVVEWLRPQETVVFLTKEARELHWERFRSMVGDKTKLIARDIPAGQSEEELWQIFDIVVESVQQREEIVVDITHAFRSLPMLLLSIVMFLRATREVCVKHIFYGQYLEGKDEAPVLDLILFLQLLDWASATQRFKETGDARWIGKTLCQTHRQLWKDQAARPQHLHTAGSSLQQLSQALQLARPIEAAQTAQGLLETITNAAQEIAAWAKPFSLLLEEVQQQAGQLAYEQAEVLDESYLRKQVHFIRSLHACGMVMQSALMAREWIVNWAIWRRAGGASLQKEEWLSPEVRSLAEEEMNCAFSPRRQAIVQLAWLNHPQEGEILRNLWPALCDLRNDLAHCGMRTNPLAAEKLREHVEEYLNRLPMLLQLAISTV
ncbi:MAG: TIGR02221 family CRISPR-associated protein [Armatimonadota bacterium]|nr:TIGR02221 family CRISPR-associated protein [Armatimonadota bacterium]